MRKIITTFLLLTETLSPFTLTTFAAETPESRKFIVTAYYSPLPDQSFYIRGSYEADIRLNGNGTHGASGKEVYPGMLAAPKTYAFGTKIYLGGFGVATVDDRGGAIVWSGSRGYDADRLDMWMGSGEDGLRRALTWGKRTIMGKIVSDDEADDYDPIALEQFRIGAIKEEKYASQDPILTTTGNKELWSQSSIASADDIFTFPITKQSNATNIQKLQSVLKDLSYFEGETNGEYSKVLEGAIYDFQIENHIVASRKNYGAGFYGPKTRWKMKEVYARYMEYERKRVEDEARLALEKSKEEERIMHVRKEALALVVSFWAPKDQEVGIHIRKLQKTLKLLGYFSGKDTAIFGKNTREALVHYQQERNIIASADKTGAGIIWEKTKLALVDDLMELKNKKDSTIVQNKK